MTAFAHAGHFGPEAVIDTVGRAQKNVPLSVRTLQGVTATLYTDATRTSSTDNPVLTDAQSGNLSFYADPGDYLLVGSGTSIQITVPADPRDLQAEADSRAAGDTAAVAAAVALVDDLSGVTNAPAARTALGLGSAATHAATDFELAGAVATAVAALINAAPAWGDTLGELAAQMANDESAVTALTTAVAGKLNVVIHGATAGTARPSGALVTLWIGQSTPTSAVTDDMWIDKSVTPAVFRRHNGTSFDLLGGSGGGTLTWTAVKTSAYTAAAGDAVPVDTTSAGVIVTLPTAPTDKTQVLVKHVVQGGANVVTVASGGSDVFNRTGGATSFSLSLASQAVWLQYRSSGGIWYVLASDLPLSQLDARYVSIANAAPLDTTASDIQPTTTGSAAAGSSGLSADARHVHKIGAHAATHATGNTDPITPASIGALATTAAGANNGVAQLDSGGKIPTSQLPAITMNTVWPSVASQAAMLALSAEPGDVAVRTDTSVNFMLSALPASTLGNWVQLAGAAGGVSSVFGRTGAVTLLKSDVTATGLAAADIGADASGAASTVQANLTSEISRAQTAELARMLLRGAWAATTAYAVNDAVIAGGLSWRCITAHTSGSTFSGDLTKWEPQALLYEAIDTVAIASGTTTHTMSPVYLSTMKRYTLANTASCAFTLPAATAGASFSAIFEQDATGGRAFTIVAAGGDSLKWIPNVTPTFSTVASAADEVAGRCYVAGQWRLTANIGG